MSTSEQSKTLDSQELGTLFERATIPVLKELFSYWGYDYIKPHRQKSGTQHGFDILFTLSKNYIPLYVFIECKASETYNYIDVYDLKKKIDQFDWAGYPHKDIHLFLSFTRCVGFDNQVTSIEDDSLPFIVIDWMRKPDTLHPFAELFFVYKGDNSDVLQYRDELKETVGEISMAKTFSEIAEELHKDFERRINEYYAIEYRQDCQFINGAFWERVWGGVKTDYIDLYYTKADSKNSRLQEVVASDSYIRNPEMEKEFEDILSQTAENPSALIEILSRGGEGKSTFMHHIAKHYYRDYNIFYLYNFDEEILEAVRAALTRLNNRQPVMLLLDDASAYGDCLVQLKNRLDLGFRNYKLLFVTAERDIRYDHIENLDIFRDIFDDVYTIEFITTFGIRKQIFNRLFSILNVGDALVGEKQEELKQIYLEDKRRSTTENTFAVLKNLTEKEKARIKFTFDWEDWEAFATGKYSHLERLYLLLATFYQFGFSLDMEFCAEFLGADTIDINNAMEANPNLPIYRRGKKLYLRHETIADWFLNHKKRNKENSEHIFKMFLNFVSTPFARTLFIRLYKNKEFLKSYLNKYMTDERRVEILSNYIKKYPEELNCRTELSKIYQKQKKLKEAEDILIELKNIDPDNLQARTELSKIYQQQKKWKDAEDILLELKKLDPNNLQARTELSKIYQQQKKWKDAEDILLELKKLDPNNLQARTELSKIYQQQKKWKEAEAILKECLDIEKDDLDSRTELSKIYQKQKKWKEAENILLECLQIKKDDINSMLELARLFRKANRLAEAEIYLKKILDIDPKNLHALSELSFLYNKRRQYRNREDILFEIYELNPKDIYNLTALNSMFARFRKYRVALKLLETILSVKNDDLLSVIIIIDLYKILNDKNNVTKYHEIGKSILSKHKYKNYASHCTS